MIDSSGYIVVTMEHQKQKQAKVGDFFGAIQREVMQKFIDNKIFDHVEVFNYQALCPLSMIKEPNCALSLNTVQHLIKK